MTEILISTWAALVNILSGVWEVVLEILMWVGNILYHLHVDAPRVEGLLVGVILTWVLLRRDRHPALRVLSAPLKLVVDILDLTWDQVVEIYSDAKEFVAGWFSKAWDLVVNTVKKPWLSLLSTLQKVKEKVSKKDEEKSS